MAATASLLKEWDLLQQKLMPPLLQVAPARAPHVWTIGSAEDAVALAVAYHHAFGDYHAADIRVFLSGRDDRSEPVHFALSDIRCVPRTRVDAAFLRDDRRWVPRARVMERVVLGAPVEPVDLLTLRARPGRDPATILASARTALARVRRGGHLLCAGDAPLRLVPGEDFRPLGEGGRLYERVSGGEPPDGLPVPESPQTLAEHEMQARMVESHVNLARSLARRFAHHGEMTDDLEQVALLALVKAAGRYSPDHGSSFATFATASILGELKRHFRDKTWMLRVPRSLQESYLSVKGARDELSQTLGSSPTIRQIADHVGISEEAVLAAMEAGDSYWPASLDAPRRGEEDSSTDVPVSDNGFDSSLDRRLLRESLPRLDRREQLIIKRLYFDGWTQRRVAEEIGVSQMQVSRLMARILEKLRAAFDEG